VNETPVYDALKAGHDFTKLPTEYTDRYTPEVARNEGWLAGAEKMRERILKMAGEVSKPTKQLLEFIEKIEAIDYE